MEELRNKLLRDLSHQLKTPASIIEMSANMLSEKLCESGVFCDEATNKSLKRILNNSVEMRELVSSILQLSSIEVGKSKIEKTEFDLVQVVSQVVESMHSLTIEKDIKLEFDSPEKLRISSDVKRVATVASILIENAIKYTNEGGVKVSLKRINGDLELAVKDSGKGLSKEQLKLIFMKFYQTDPSIPGVGLGLNIAKETISLLGGKITAESEGLGKGSVFKITLPIK